MSVVSKQYLSNSLEVTFQISEEFQGLRLDQFLQTYLKSHSREDIKKKIKKNECIILNRPESKKASSKLHDKDQIKIVINKSTHEDEWWNGKKLELDTPREIFEDENLIVINKPPFMSTHPTGKHLFNCATVFYEQKLNLPTVHSIHRLDRETSGVLLLAKNPHCANQLTKEFENDQVQKCYFWIAKKTKEQQEYRESFSARERMGSLDQGLKRVYVYYFNEGDSQGKKAATDFKVIFQNDMYAMGLAFPKTGRTHQIRVHALAHGLPLVGDKLYLESYELFQRFKDNLATEEDHQKMMVPRHALHAFGIKIKYQNSPQIFFSDLPRDFLTFSEKNFNVDEKEIFNRAKELAHNYFN